MKAILTGHKGFIGSNLLKELGQIYNLYLIGKEDAKNSDLESMVANSDIIFHNGAISDTSLQNYNEMLFYNYLFSKKLIDLSQKYNKKMIFAGSASIYGNGDDIQSIYAWSKTITESYGVSKHPNGFTSLRYFNVYGSGESQKGKMASVAYQAWEHNKNHGTPFKLFPKSPRRDFVYIKDVISANLKAIHEKPGIYDVGHGEAVKFETLLDGMNIPYEYTNEDVIPFWYQFYTSADKSKWLPNWKPKWDIISGTKDYLEKLQN